MSNGGGLLSYTMDAPKISYTLERVMARQIRRFNVRGTEYRLRIEPIEDGVTYAVATDMIHDVFERKCVIGSIIIKNAHTFFFWHYPYACFFLFFRNIARPVDKS